jgi:hypothetical protein
VATLADEENGYEYANEGMGRMKKNIFGYLDIGVLTCEKCILL